MIIIVGVGNNSIFIVANNNKNINYVPSEPIPIPTKPKIQNSVSLAFSPNLRNKKNTFNTY